ncbi:MAG TPA: pyrroline-5-carboxylate reductase [Solimonas sp.]|nr:pyrroline-5-carboxylate reductase [Solimonas sp.]
MQETIAFIGGGNMAASLVGGLLAAGCPASRIRVAEPLAERAAWLRSGYGVATFDSGAQAVGGAQAIVLAVKPQQMREALAGVRPDPGAVIVSIAAGVRLELLRELLGSDAHYVRTMPNTPALLRQGISGMFTPLATPPAARALAERILQAAGETVWLESEAQMDAVTALSGSGPAYFFLLTEVLREAGAALGLDPSVAAKLARQTFIGAAAMAAGESDVAELRRNVTSKGGTTEAALKVLEAAGIRGIFEQALTAAANRGQALGDELSRIPNPESRIP